MNTIGDAVSVQSHEDKPTEQYDLVILGGGTGSTIAAWTFASDRPKIHRRIVPEHRVPAQQKYYSRRSERSWCAGNEWQD
jgi:hypothetical protein